MPATWQAYMAPLANLLQYHFDAIPKSVTKCACNCHLSQNYYCDIVGLLQLRVVFPLTEPWKPPGGNSRKIGKNYKIPSPVQPPKMGKNYRKITKNTTLLTFSLLISVDFCPKNLFGLILTSRGYFNFSGCLKNLRKCTVKQGKMGQCPGYFSIFG